MKTLIVDDDDSSRRLLEQVSMLMGHEVTVCSNAIDALELYKKEAFNLILLDWMMPVMDGLELCRAIRKLPHGDDSIILIITARDGPQDLQEALVAGADDYIPKPISGIDILKVRLTVAENSVMDRAKRKEAEATLDKMYDDLKKSHDDLRSVLGQLRVGAMIVDEKGEAIFLNRSAETMLGSGPSEELNRRWSEIFAPGPEDLKRIEEMKKLPVKSRSKVAINFVNQKGVEYWVDLEISDDPQNPGQVIFLFYDISEIAILRSQLADPAPLHGIIGQSAIVNQMRKRIEDFSKLDWTVLIEGETGAGKELIAKAIHFTSDRKEKPFVAVNTAGLSDSLLTTQLFGHRRGAFTGAVQDQPGLFESAEGGTLFLDEIGDISPNIQVSLLRALEERAIVRLGESRERKIDVRFITATNRDLNKEVESGAFRSDLLYRIRVARVTAPPLRNRREDIPLLLDHFLELSRAATGKEIHGVSHEAMRALMEHPWPGNVRELKSAIDYAVIHSEGPVINSRDLPPEIKDVSEKAQIVNKSMSHHPMSVEEAIRSTGGNRAKAAKLLGISRATLYRRLSENK